MNLKLIRDACRLLGYGDPEIFERMVKIGLALTWLPILSLIIPEYFEELIGFESFIAFLLSIPPIIMIIYGFYPAFKFKSHVKAVEREASFAILAVNIGVNAGLSPVKAFEELAEMNVLKAVSSEVKRILRDCSLYRRHLSEQMAVEARRAGGLWAKLIKILVSLERVGGDPKFALGDLMNETLRDLKIQYEVLSNRFRSMISSSNVLFGALPMMLSVLFTLTASQSIIPIILSFTVLNIFTAIFYMLLVDGQIPQITSYMQVYMKIVFKWLPLSLSFGAILHYGFIEMPLTLIASKAVTVTIASLIFNLPAWVEFKIHAKAIDEILEYLPTILRDLADEIERGFTPHQALENISGNASYGKFTDKFIALLVKRARIYGSLRDALTGIGDLLPIQARLALWLIILGEELGATSTIYHELADLMFEYYLALKSFRRSCQGYRWMAIGLAALTITLVITLFSTLISKISLIGQAAFQAGQFLTLPFNIADPGQLPKIKDWIYTSISLNSIILGLTAGKTLDWRIGGGFRDATIISTIMLAALTLTFTFGIL
ncbi:MAG: type II secretion system F family protein [Candidatus Verstraetearchaeota archaeon]|nr:type II secretion system F family protein [Candidatus Verstraetearchaeota archaeon]